MKLTQTEFLCFFFNEKKGLVTISKSTRLSIGELDDSVPKSLLPSQPYCKLKQTPDAVFEQIVSYVQRYFECFDTNRDNLLGAYSDKCTFSLSINLSNAVVHRSFRFDDHLFKENRNLKKYNGIRFLVYFMFEIAF